MAADVSSCIDGPCEGVKCVRLRRVLRQTHVHCASLIESVYFICVFFIVLLY